MKKAKNLFRILYSLPKTLYFNFHYLPFKQAIHLPILLYKPNLVKCSGKISVITDMGGVKTGMIKLGFPYANIYPNNGIIWENNGGKIIFKGRCTIGNAAAISVGRNAEVIFGDNFANWAAMKLVSVKGIEFGEGVSIGWNCMIIDTDFHPLYDINAKCLKKASGKIYISDDNWFAAECKILHSAKTSEHCSFGLGSLINKNVKTEPYCLLVGTPAHIVCRNVMLHPKYRTEKN